ncbi:YbhB/YbcL family Raf kinase inhibitor-like protein [Aromatoleum diolicum]|uniref:YbhB/YbcL family Raf kinase inhibitor-like protein n=2 Tax=Aromatoleum diolicum TaxID=75796 RepID=A0ABX1Q758_9RHOO|nr:YbhB/YbcL family Raf kinase inhibitor-like protein [Aromatoleum diolicum]
MSKTLLSTLLFVPTLALAAGFSIESPDIKANQEISKEYVLNGFGCEGGNVSPALTWKNAPKGTKSFAVTVYDPDAPTGSGWWHWVVFNLPPDTTSLPQGAGDPSAGRLPKGSVQSRTDFGKPGWGGPCPPQGDKPHRFTFTVFALKTERIELGEDTPAAMVGYMLNLNSLAKASFVAKSVRK